MKNTSVKIPLFIFITGFLLNLIWENLQAPFYEEFDFSFKHFMYCFYASLIDGIVIILMYFSAAFFFHKINWLNKQTLKTIIFLALAGFVIAVIFESWALTNKEWSYASKMPRLPFTKIAILPVLQMMLLPFITFYFAKKYFIKRKKIQQQI